MGRLYLLGQHTRSLGKQIEMDQSLRPLKDDSQYQSRYQFACGEAELYEERKRMHVELNRVLEIV